MPAGVISSPGSFVFSVTITSTRDATSPRLKIAAPIRLIHRARPRCGTFNQADSLIFYGQMHTLQFFDLADRNRVSSFPLVHRAAHPDVFPQEGPKPLLLIRIGHLVRDREIQVTFLGQNDKWRTTSRACPQTLHTQVSRRCFEVLNGACNIPNQAFDCGLRLMRWTFSLRCVPCRLRQCKNRHADANKETKTQKSLHQPLLDDLVLETTYEFAARQNVPIHCFYHLLLRRSRWQIQLCIEGV